jgi:hypothetical protein
MANAAVGARPSWADRGWVVVPDLLTPAEAAALAAACARLLDAGAAAQGDKPHGGTRRAATLFERLPEVAALFGAPSVVAAVDRFLGGAGPPDDVSFRCPGPGFGQQSLHPDATPNTTRDECRAVTAIVALCDFDEQNGATVVVPGSHRRPDLQRRAPHLDLTGQEVVLTGRAGTTFVFSAHLLHRGGANRSARPRPSLQAQWRRPPRPAGGAPAAEGRTMQP